MNTGHSGILPQNHAVLLRRFVPLTLSLQGFGVQFVHLVRIGMGEQQACEARSDKSE